MNVKFLVLFQNLSLIFVDTSRLHSKITKRIIEIQNIQLGPTKTAEKTFYEAKQGHFEVA